MKLKSSYQRNLGSRKPRVPDLPKDDTPMPAGLRAPTLKREVHTPKKNAQPIHNPVIPEDPLLQVFRDNFYHDPAGFLYRRYNNQLAGCMNSAGFLVAGYLADGKQKVTPIHRIIFALAHGRMPTPKLRHANGIKTDNRVANLEEVNPVPKPPRVKGKSLRINIIPEDMVDVLDYLFCYNPDTGAVTRRRKYNKSGPAGSPVGTPCLGYLKVSIRGQTYGLHQIAWAMHHREWPKHPIDHEDRNRSNNKISNLRMAGGGKNSWNLPLHPRNTSGTPGVRWDPAVQKWHAKITAKGKQIHLGYFEEKEQAVAARRAAETGHHVW